MHTRLKYLLDRHLQNTSSEEEQAEFDELINNPSNEAELLRLLEGKWNLNDFSPRELSETRSEEILKNILESDVPGTEKPAQIIRFVPWWRISVAIILILVCVTGAYLYFSPQEKATRDSIAKNVHPSGDALPGTQSATLELSNHRKIQLDSLLKGEIAKEDEVGLTVNNRRLNYNGSADNAAPSRYNIVSTSNGQAYSVRFLDGTQVWLNAGSSIKYPVPFAGDFRNVEITGEVEFEVTRNTTMPFRVLVPGDKSARELTVQVLGTHFKINAYPGEKKVKTTLLEGSVQLMSGSKTLKIKPGQQGSLDSAGDFHVVDLPNADKIVDVKSGLFFFADDDIRTVLRDVARWYDVELVYEENIAEHRFSGRIQKSLTLKAVLNKLESYASFEIEDKKLIVTQ